MSFIYKKRSKLLQNLLRKNKHIHLSENCWFHQGCCVFGYLFLCKGVSRCLSGHLRGRCFICSPILPQKIQLCNSKTVPKQCQNSANLVPTVSISYQNRIAENVTKFALQKKIQFCITFCTRFSLIYKIVLLLSHIEDFILHHCAKKMIDC